MQTDLLKQVVGKLSPDEAAILDAGFKPNEVQQAGLQCYVLRLRAFSVIAALQALVDQIFCPDQLHI